MRDRAMTALRTFFVALLVCWAGVAAADVAVPPLTGRLVDQTGTLTQSDIASLNAKLKDLEQRKGSQVAVLIVPTTQPETIEQFSIRAAEAWKIGRRKIDDGALLVIAKNDHRLRIEVGYGLEGSLTDVTSRRIIDEVITPEFRFGDFAGGISKGVDRIIGVINGEPLPRPAPQATSTSDSDWSDFLNPLNPFTLFGIYVIASICRSLFGRLTGSAASGVVVGALGWFLFGSVALALLLGGIVSMLTFFAGGIIAANNVAMGSGRRAGGGWSGGFVPGGGSGWSSGSRDSDSGFSGGGGSFGGGGASGSW
jgi:uncharacterized protein